MRDVITPPAVSIPIESGVTSSKRMSLMFSSVSPDRIAACTVAPIATASSGLRDLHSSLPLKKSDSNFCTFGMRVEPPTRMISSTSPLDILASASTFWTGSMVLRKTSAQSSSKRARVIEERKSSPSWRLSSSKLDCVLADRLRFAFSHAVRRRRRALGLPVMSFLVLRLNSLAKWSTKMLSMSSPPRWLSPAVALTSKIPSSTDKSVTS